jgi:hypothetical protein
MKTAIKKQILEMGYTNGETLDHKAQSMLCRACAGDSPNKVERFHRLFREMTTGNHTLNGSPLTLKL